ncbi:hypothetical protein [Saccharopolyspora pogona]|uniref:hypothetical protein n=1 Tax=Saccharopolyspora pogona TaxID=333966 RepID=UPI0016899B85|nr:hypothetical protein [Saccharopolyspora pogona]
MTSDEALTQAQEDFCAHVRAGEAALKGDEPSVAEADRHTDATNAQVAEWDKQGITAAVLLPLLAQDQAPAIRCAAATYLLNRGHETEALPALEALADDDEIGLVADDADMAIVQWRRKQADQTKQ